MKKVLILFIVALLVGLFAFMALFSSQEQSPTETDESLTEELQVNETARSESDTISGRGSMAALLNRGTAFECAVVYNPGDMSGVVTGTLFTSSGKLRADFLMNSTEFGEYVSSLIVLPNMTYSWSQIDGETYGVKMATEGGAEPETAMDPNLPVQFDEDVQYTCDEWTNVDESVFTPPSDTLFQDLGEIQNAGMEYGTIYEEGEF